MIINVALPAGQTLNLKSPKVCATVLAADPSLSVCLPDETRMLGSACALQAPLGAPPGCLQGGEEVSGEAPESAREASAVPRRLMAARDDSRPLYLNTQGIRVGCKEEVLQVKERGPVEAEN